MSYKELSMDRKAFNKLRQRWYNRLKNEGFIDIEYGSKDRFDQFNDFSGLMRKPLSVYRSRFNFFTLLYYEISRFIGNHAPFLSRIDAKLLELHGEGYTILKISTYLRANYNSPLNKKGRNGIPYSTYYVHSRLKVLKSLILVYSETNCLDSVKESWQLL